MCNVSQFGFVLFVDFWIFRGEIWIRFPGVVDSENDWLARESLNVSKCGKRKLVIDAWRFDVGRLSRRMTSNAVMPETAQGMIEWELVIVDDALIGSWVAPKPSVLRAGRIFDHDRPRFEGFAKFRFGLALMLNGWMSVLLFDHHFAIGNRADPPVHQPGNNPWRIVDANRRVGSVILAVNERARVTNAFVLQPI